VSRSRVSPCRQYLRDIPGNLRVIRADLRSARSSARHLLPFMWRVEAERLREQEGFDMFHLGQTWDGSKSEARQ
jgi:hypothetical protein